MLHLDVERRAGYLYACATGALTVASAQDALREVLAAAARHQQPRILLDCSRLAADWSSEQRYEIGSFLAAEAQRLGAQLPERPRIAIYAVAPLMDPNRFTQRVATNRGAQVRASDSLQELLSWLEA
jgi:hypothetical protein